MMWRWVLLACAGCFATKLAGFLVPRRFLDDHRTVVTMAGMTVGVLAGLVALSTVEAGGRVVADARLAALVVALVVLRLKAPFLLVVVLGAAAAALVRLLGVAG
ncbi:MAG: AzlD domain-containing protein [Arachnia propionica]|uniref:AzlD domain-containing protein n=1 Tax=Arachnia propionica TaxID=1750 RepID=UPI0026F8F8FA|nr:AzlD domain-containing protein [Arachnia propionica]